MTAISIEDIVRDPMAFLRRVEEAGETLVVLRDDHAIAELRPPASSYATSAASHAPRPYGLCAGKFAVPEDFDSPLPEDILADFEG